MAYIRCPRCELNFIDKKEKYCSVCKMEMKATGEVGDRFEMELCPVCHFNLISPDQDMCDSCKEEVGGEIFSESTDKEWQKYIGEFNDYDIDSGIDEFDDEESDEDSENIGENASIAELGDEELGMVLDDDFMDFEKDADDKFDNDSTSDDDSDNFEDDDDDDDDDYDDDDDDDYDDDDDDDENDSKKKSKK